MAVNIFYGASSRIPAVANFQNHIFNRWISTGAALTDIVDIRVKELSPYNASVHGDVLTFESESDYCMFTLRWA